MSAKHIDEMIENLMRETESDRIPEWAQLLRDDLDELKSLIRTLIDQNDAQDFRQFVRQLRRALRAVPHRHIYPKIRYGTMELGVDKEGKIYDLESGMSLSAKEAYDLFGFLYERRDRLHMFVTGGRV